LSRVDANKGLIFDIQRFSIHDGPGIRSLVFFKGCPLRCLWCSNPEAQNAYVELGIDPTHCMKCESCISVCNSNAIKIKDNGPAVKRRKCTICGKCASQCVSGTLQLIGRIADVKEIMREVEKDSIFYTCSDGGVTFSGGEPLSQPDFLRELLITCKKRGFHTAIETSGYSPYKNVTAILPWLDLILYDIKILDSAKHKYYTGVSNDLIKDNFKLLTEEKNINMVVRHPVIPGINDDIEEEESLYDFLQNYRDKIDSINLIPYHKLGKYKYDKLNRYFNSKEIIPPTEEKMKSLLEKYSGIGVHVQVGG